MKTKTFIHLLFGITFSCFITASCSKTDLKPTIDGVSSELAELRNQQFSNIKYLLSFSIPDSVNTQITGNEIIEFNYTEVAKNPVILDFRNPEQFIKSVRVNNKKIKYIFKNEHIIIADSKFLNGKNQIEIEFTAGDRALNRNNEYLYTLFVPDRACTAFPCFDQPSLKASFKLELKVPYNWIAVGNAKLLDTLKNEDNTKVYAFDESEPISTYLFAFVAGKFKSVSKTFDNNQITMYHRENDTAKLLRNTDKIFELQYSSLKWLEEYTQIKYPFQKLDFIIIPSFQYSGMEHPGAILYRDSKLFLEESSTVSDELNRANLIAHETAHMWFGDLVTMEWFSEVWLKEVFANFMAGKIVNPQYPEVNHDLNFLISHYPASYSIDRTKGANAIEQELDNMKNAGTLYGSIIYHKAPIVMNQLELITGEDLLKDGVREYLNKYKYGNASWNDLIGILDSKTDYALEEWSKSWVFEPGMPHYTNYRAYNTENKLQTIIIQQTDPSEKGRQWPQMVNVQISEDAKKANYSLQLKDTFNIIVLGNEGFKVSNIFTNSNGLAYGYFKLDSISKDYFLANTQSLKDPVLRCSMYICLWENMLNEIVLPNDLLQTYIRCLAIENDPQNINLTLGYIESLYWSFLKNSQKDEIAESLESFIWDKIIQSNTPGVKSAYFNAYKTIATSQNAINRIYDIWSKKTELSKLNLSEKDFTEIAFELAIRNTLNSDSILQIQYNRIENLERKERFEFIKAAVSKDINIRDQFFNSLKLEKNREKEPWVADALTYLHHPLHSNESVKYIRASLDILEELQITGDIFFPQQWLSATFSGHSSIDAVTEINLFLNENPNFPKNLKNKILQSSDLVFRASIIKNE